MFPKSSLKFFNFSVFCGLFQGRAVSTIPTEKRVEHVFTNCQPFESDQCTQREKEFIEARQVGGKDGERVGWATPVSREFGGMLVEHFMGP